MWATGTRVRKSPLLNLSGKLDRLRLGWIAGKWLRRLAQKDQVGEVTQRYDRHGKRLLQITHGGASIEIDPADRSVWIAGMKKLWHYSAGGEKLGGYGGVSDSQKWIAVAPGSEELARK